MKAIPLHRVATVMPFIRFLTGADVPVERELQRARLPVHGMDDPDLYIPTQNYWSFIDSISHREGLQQLGFEVGRQYGTSAADAHSDALLRHSPTLLHGLQRYCELVNTEISQVHLQIEHLNKKNTRLHYRPSFGSEHPAYSHFEWYGLMAVIDTIRVFTGPGWQPTTIGLASLVLPDEEIATHFPETRFLVGQPRPFIDIENTLLSRSPRPAEPGKNGMTGIIQQAPVPRLATEFIGSVKQLLPGYFVDGTPCIDLVAEIAGTSTRSLQRYLKIAGLSYRGLMEQVRYDIATRLLSNTDETIMAIAQTLGYADATHFARAFRRLAGISPRQFRQLQRLH